MTIKSAKDIVLEKYPAADAVYHKAVHETGQSAPIQDARWAVYVAPGLGQRELGSGPTEAAAWTNASTEVLKDLRPATGMQISRDNFDDAGVVSGGPPVADELQDAADRGMRVTIKEHDGSETPIERNEG